MLKRILLVLVLICFAVPAQADSTVNQLMDWLNQKETVVGKMARTYLMGAMTALVSANAILESRNQQKIYCQPKSSVLTVDDVQLALRLYIEGSGKEDFLGKQDALVFLPFVLQTIFPCK
jgi:hypothetical protein